MPQNSGPIIWTEHSPNHSPLGVLAKLEWRFFEQEEGEVRWYPRPASPTLITTAEAEYARRLRTAAAARRAPAWRWLVPRRAAGACSPWVGPPKSGALRRQPPLARVRAAAARVVLIGRRNSGEIVTRTKALLSSLYSKVGTGSKAAHVAPFLSVCGVNTGHHDTHSPLQEGRRQ